MAKKLGIPDFFTAKDVTPSSLQQSNLISFSYKSPNGVHDKAPLVWVVERQFDRIYGINLHYDMIEFNDLLESTYNKINILLEKEFYKKYPDKKQLLQKKKIKFDKQLLEVKDLTDFKRRISNNDLEKFSIFGQNSDAFRCYLYSRMNRVSKLIWKV